MKCPHCFQKYNPKLREQIIYERKVDNAINSSIKTKANGNKPGPKAVFDVGRMLHLRELNYSYREIAEMIGCTPQTVFRHNKKARRPND